MVGEAVFTQPSRAATGLSSRAQTVLPSGRRLRVPRRTPLRQQRVPGSRGRDANVTYTVRLDEVGKDDIALAGGKGANLGELSRAGLPVPPGFVVTTRAYDAFVEAGGFGEEVFDLASQA